VNSAELTGRVRTHITALEQPASLVHTTAAKPLLALRRAAAADGIDLIPVSSFRDFSRQLSIWNGKFLGERILRDADGTALDAKALSPAERIDVILLWSALPGASRHHWGTDVDFIDGRAVAPGYQPQLTTQEFEAGGPFAPLSAWLESHAPRFGFFRPYQGVRSGVQPEPWHFSFAPTAENARRQLTPAILHEAISGAALEGKDWVLPRIEELHTRYVATVEIP
jgi:LAS superfamily LD-carboxypeptidase LdcB